MITLQKLNVVKVVTTEDAAQKLEAAGFTRTVDADSRKSYIEADDDIPEDMVPEIPAEEVKAESLPPGILVEELTRENPPPEVTPKEKTPNGASADITSVSPAKEVEQYDAGADKPHRGGSKK